MMAKEHAKEHALTRALERVDVLGYVPDHRHQMWEEGKAVGIFTPDHGIQTAELDRAAQRLHSKWMLENRGSEAGGGCGENGGEWGEEGGAEEEGRAGKEGGDLKWGGGGGGDGSVTLRPLPDESIEDVLRRGGAAGGGIPEGASGEGGASGERGGQGGVQGGGKRQAFRLALKPGAVTLTHTNVCVRTHTHTISRQGHMDMEESGEAQILKSLHMVPAKRKWNTYF
jgi:hypothetical protein